VRNADIKQWLFRSDNYEIHSILFEKDALINAVGNEVFNQDFGFFNDELYKLNLNKDQAFQLESDFLDFKKIYLQKHKMRNRKLAHFLAIILYSIAEISSGIFPPGTLSRARELTNQFIGLACKHVVNERSLDYYSDRMGISTKHLSETVKSVLDKPASAVLADLLLLEAKVRLKESTFTVEEIAFQLHFNDASAFNKFFKRHAGTTPNQYRKA
jgi:AraC-like DNA-binding protein